MQKRLVKIFVLILVSHNVFGQANRDSLENLFGIWYDSIVGQETNELMYNSIYLTALRGRTTHQYFDQRVWQTGSLNLSGELYSNVAMLFDIEREQLIIKHPDSYRWDGIAVNMDSLLSFTLAGHQFRKLPFQNDDGFYDVLFDGENLLLLAKRKKRNSLQKEGVELESTTNYFIVKDDRLIPLKGMKTLRMSYPKYKDVIQEIRREEKVRMRLRKEETIVRFIDSLDAKMKLDL